MRRDPGQWLSAMALVLFAAASFAAGVEDSDALRKRERSPAEMAVHEALLRQLVPRYCRVFLCLLGVEQKAVDNSLIEKLGAVGQVAAVQPDDFTVEDGAYRGFSHRNGRIIDIRKLSFSSTSEALVDAAFLSTGLSSRVCTYRLFKRREEWMLDDKETRCSIS